MSREMPVLLLVILPALLAVSCGKPPAEDPAGPLGDMTTLPWEWYPWSGDRLDSLPGEVVDPAGRPVAGARVSVMLMPLATFTPLRRVESTISDAEGRFTLRRVPTSAFVMADKPGLAGQVVPALKHLVEARRPTRIVLGPSTEVTGIAKYEDGRVLANYPVWAMSRSGDWFGTTETDAEGRFRFVDTPITTIVVVATPGRVRGRSPEFQVEVGNPREVFVTVQAVAAVSGQVIEEATGVPIPGAVVHTRVQEEEFVRADANGRFRLEGAHTGMVLAHADGYGEVVVSLPAERKETEDVYLRLAPAARVRGRVVDRAGRGIANARVRALQSSEGALPISRGPLTRVDGTFDYTWIPVPPEGGQVTLCVEHPDHAPMWTEEISLLRGQEVTGLSLTMGDYGSVNLRLVDEKGEPWVAAETVIRREKEESVAARLSHHGQDSYSISDTTGEVQINNLRPGSWSLTVKIPGRLPVRLPFTVEDGRQTDLGEQVIPHGLVLAGRVVDQDGEPLPQARLRAEQPGKDEGWELPLDVDAAFRMQGFTEGEYTLVVNAADHETARMPVKAGQEGLSVRVVSLGTLAVTLVGPAEESGLVEVERLDAPPAERQPESQSVERGIVKADFRHKVAGLYRVRAWRGDLFGVATVDLPLGRETPVEVALSPGGLATGRVVDRRGLPLDSVGIDIDLGERYGRRFQWTAVDGRFVVRALPEGRWPLVARGERRPAVSSVVEVVPGRPSTVDLVLPDGARIRIVGTLQESGAPAPGIVATLTTESGALATYWIDGDGKPETNSQGTLTLTGIAAGTYTLSLSIESEVVERRKIRLEADQELEIPVAVPK